MTSINFDEPSVGNVNSDDTNALTIKAGGRRSACIRCESTSSTIIASSEIGTGIAGIATTAGGVGLPGGVGVLGQTAGRNGIGVRAVSRSPNVGIGVKAEIRATNGIAVWGQSSNSNPDSIATGVHGESRSGNGIGVIGHCERGIGVRGSGRIAGRFEGDVEVTGDIKLLNADCAEDFDISESETKRAEPGTVMVLTENGSLQSSHQEYDKKVAGVVSGASGYKPAIVLDRQEQQDRNTDDENGRRLPIALVGKVYCKVDARHTSIEIGDLLTTSSTKGYAMRAEDPIKSFGAVIGKALGSIKDGLGMIPVLVSLQ